MVIDSLAGLVNGRFGLDAVSGPIGVAEVVGEAAKTNVNTFLYIIAILTHILDIVRQEFQDGLTATITTQKPRIFS